MVVKHGLYYSFNRSASDSQHKSLVCVLFVHVCVLTMDACAWSNSAWRPQPANQRYPEFR